MKQGLIALLLMLSMAIVSAQELTDVEVSPAFNTHIARLSQYAEARRELTLPQPLPLNFPTRDDLRGYLQRQFDLALTQESLDESLRFYTIFGWLPADTDLRGLIEEFYAGQVGGFYDTETKEMNVVLLSTAALGDRLPIIEQIVYVHEYVHALQDAAFDLATYLADPDDSRSADEYLARLALVEGDATLVMNEFAIAETERNPLGVLTGLLLGGLRAGNLTLPPGTPDIIANELLFPYMQGELFVRSLYATNGWSAVNDAFSNPPTTTEQILHPDKYLAGEVGQPVWITNGAGKMGADWTLTDEGVLGEFYLSEFLATQLTSADAATAAAGWNGDAYHIYEDTTGRLALQLRIEWDTDADLIEFQEAINAYGESRYGTAADGSGCFFDGEQALCSNGRVVMIAPTVDLALLMVSE